jgi:glutamate-1-semialdehyde 2,1-aminomutase
MSTVMGAVDTKRLEALIAREEEEFTRTHARSGAMAQEASRALAGGVASSWQATDPHPIYVRDGHGSTVVDVDGNEYVDFHGGYGAMAVGHAHPAVVRAVRDRVGRGTHFAQPTEEAIAVAEHLRERYGLPLWRFGNSGTEATLDAVRVMRAVTGRDVLLKIEGSYHGHHDAVMVSVVPPAADIGPADDPVAVPQTLGLPADYVNLTRVVPFNDLDALARTLEQFDGIVAGMIVEPAMMNIGIVEPDPGYLEGVRRLTREHGVLLAFDEVKTGATIHHGGATRRYGTTPDLICLAKSNGGGVPFGAIGGSEEVMSWIADGRIDQVGTFNGNPLSMAAAHAALTEALVPSAYDHLERLAAILVEGCTAAIERHGLVAYATGLAAKGSITYSPRRVRNYRDFLEVSDPLAYVNWLFQVNRGVFLAPWGKSEQWTLSVQHSEADVRRFITNFDALGAALTG